MCLRGFREEVCDRKLKAFLSAILSLLNVGAVKACPCEISLYLCLL